MEPVYVDARPPSYARQMFKLVAVVDNEAVSIYDGVTRYPLGITVHHEAQEDHQGGLYCFRTKEECLARDDQTLPRSCALLHAPRAIARVLAWNHDGKLPVAYGAKKAYSFVQAQALMPMPATWVHANSSAGSSGSTRPASAGWALSGTGQGAITASSSSTGADTALGSTGLSSTALALSSGSGASGSDSSGTAAGMTGETVTAGSPAVHHHRSGTSSTPPSSSAVLYRSSIRPQSGITPQRAALVRRQAATMALEQEVRDLEAQLARARALLPAH